MVVKKMSLTRCYGWTKGKIISQIEFSKRSIVSLRQMSKYNREGNHNFKILSEFNFGLLERGWSCLSAGLHWSILVTTNFRWILIWQISLWSCRGCRYCSGCREGHQNGFMSCNFCLCSAYSFLWNPSVVCSITILFFHGIRGQSAQLRSGDE